MSAKSATPSASRQRNCPICRKPTVQEFRPFCSKGCRDRDFLQWADEGYKLPGAMLDDDALDKIEKNARNGLDSGLDD